MGLDAWNLTAKPCDSCRMNPSSLFCRADSAFLCAGCDTKIHTANKLASQHGRVWICEVCEQAPAIVTCKADAAALCAVCDRDIHSANPLARRHERVPIVPFYESELATKSNTVPDEKAVVDLGGGEAEEAEAASWLLPVEPNSPEYKSADYFMDPYLDINIISAEQKPDIEHCSQYDHLQQQHNSDGVVPVQIKTDPAHFHGPAIVDGFPSYDMDFSGSKPYMYNFSSQSMSQSVSSSSMEVGVVPDQSTLADESTNPARNDGIPSAITGVDREARVLRYKEKRKNRKFEKTIRYASRKAYAETRPRIKGRFAKRNEIEVESLLVAESSYGVVPTF